MHILSILLFVSLSDIIIVIITLFLLFGGKGLPELLKRLAKGLKKLNEETKDNNKADNKD